jgi:hypothetical protein
LSAVGDYRRAMVAGDLDAVVASMSPDILLNSPITLRHQFRGRDELREVYAAVLAEVTEIEYDREIVDGSTCVLIGTGTVRGQHIEETVLIGLDATGAIAEITLYVRPMPGLLALAAALAPHIGPSRGRSRLAGLLARPLAAAGKSGERMATRLVWPR